MSAIPTPAPSIEASSTTGKRASGPTQAPRPASSHTSPKPIASLRKTFSPSHAMRAKAAKPMPAPYSELVSPPAGVSPSALAATPKAMSGRVSALGRSQVSRSMSASARRTATKASSAAAAGVGPCRQSATSAMTAPATSTSG